MSDIKLNDPDAGNLPYLIKWGVPGQDCRWSRIFNTRPSFIAPMQNGTSYCGRWTGGIDTRGYWEVRNSMGHPEYLQRGWSEDAEGEVENIILRLYREEFPDWPIPPSISYRDIHGKIRT
jgi:hypothetical protein